MRKISFAIICTILFALTMAANTGISTTGTDRGSTTSLSNQESDADDIDSLDMDMIINECNQSFRIEMTNLESLNKSGSFIDENDRTSKCFMRCMLMNMGIVSQDGFFNPERAAVLFSGERNGKTMDDIADMTSNCATNRNERCLCDRSYQFMRCLMSMEIEKYEGTR